MKTGMKKGIACILAVCVSTGAGIWFVSSQNLQGENTSDGELVLAGMEYASTYAGITSLQDLLDYHDTVVLAEYEGSGETYSMGVTDVPLPDGTTVDLLEWYVDTQYTVTEVLCGDLQAGDSVTVQEHLAGETAVPYSQVIQISGTEGTLLFLDKMDDGYGISTPQLSMQPVCMNEESNQREIQWLNGETQMEETGAQFAVEQTTLASLNGNSSYVSTVEQLYTVVAQQDAFEEASLPDQSPAS